VEPAKEPAKELVMEPEHVKEPPTTAHTVYGQDANMAQLRAWFAKPNYRAAVLWGASGVGKNMAAYSLSPHVVEFNALSTNVCAELYRSLRTCSPLGRIVVLLNGADDMPPAALLDIVKALEMCAKNAINPLVITCTALHLLPNCLKTDSLVLHFARLQPAAMRALLSCSSTGLQNYDHVITLANGDARQALLIAQYETSSLGSKDLSASPFQMVHALMNTAKKTARPALAFFHNGADLTKQPLMVSGQFKAPVNRPFVRAKPTYAPGNIIDSDDTFKDKFKALLEDFEACIFAHYLVPRHAIGEQPPRDDAEPKTKLSYCQRRVWPFEADFVNLAPELSDWCVLFHGRTLQQDVQTLMMYELPSLILQSAISRCRLKPREVMHVSDHVKNFGRQRWDPDASLKTYISRRQMN
jgi:hypothetical protein